MRGSVRQGGSRLNSILQEIVYGPYHLNTRTAAIHNFFKSIMLSIHTQFSSLMFRVEINANRAETWLGGIEWKVAE